MRRGAWRDFSLRSTIIGAATKNKMSNTELRDLGPLPRFGRFANALVKALVRDRRVMNDRSSRRMLAGDRVSEVSAERTIKEVVRTLLYTALIPLNEFGELFA